MRVRSAMTWHKSISIMMAMNFQAKLDSGPGKGRLKLYHSESIVTSKIQLIHNHPTPSISGMDIAIIYANSTIAAASDCISGPAL